MSNKNKLIAYAHKHADIAILPFAFFIVLIFMTIFSSGKFLNITTINSIAVQIPELGLFTFAIMITMITGGIDLSIISIANLSGVIMAFLFKTLLVSDSINNGSSLLIIGIIIVGLLVALMLGFINGILIAYIGVSPILTTLGTMILYEGLTLAITKGYVISDFPDIVLQIGRGELLGIPIPFLIFICFAIFLHGILTYRPLGKYFFMIGSNIMAVQYSGIHIKRVLVKAYLFSSFYAGLASIIMLSRFNSANARNGSSYLLLSALLAIMGGTNPEGGSGNILGVVMAIIVLQMLTSGLNLLGVTSFVSVALWGLLLIAIMFYRRAYTQP